MPPPGMSLRLRLRLARGRLRYHSENDTERSAPVMTIDFDAAADCADHSVHGSTRYDTVRVRKLSPNEFELLELLGGDVIVAAYWRIGADGATLWRWGVGKSPAGRSRAYEEVFVKADRSHDAPAEGWPP